MNSAEHVSGNIDAIEEGVAKNATNAEYYTVLALCAVARAILVASQTLSVAIVKKEL